MQEKNSKNFKPVVKKKKDLLFLEILNIKISIRTRRRPSMSKELECPICDADIPLEGTERPGDLVLCSYCKVTFKIISTKDKWILSDDFEE